MPAPTPDVRELAQALYMQGLMPKAIAEKTGCKVETVHTWTARHGWAELRDKAVKVGSEDAKRAIGDQLKEMLGLKLLDLGKAAKSLAKPRGSEAIKSQAEALEAIIKPAKTVFGWTDQGKGSTGLISVQILSQSVTKPAIPTVDDQSTVNVIDVTPEAELTLPEAKEEGKHALPEEEKTTDEEGG